MKAFFLIITVLSFLINSKAYAQQTVKYAPLIYKSTRLNYDFKNTLPRAIKRYDNQIYVATINSIFQFDSVGGFVRKTKMSPKVEMIIDFYLTSKSDFFIIGQNSYLFIVSKDGILKKEIHSFEHQSFIENKGLVSVGYIDLPPNYDEKLFTVLKISEAGKVEMTKTKKFKSGQISCSNSVIWLFENSDTLFQYDYNNLRQIKFETMSTLIKDFNSYGYLGVFNTKHLFLVKDDSWRTDTLVIADFTERSLKKICFKFKQPKLRLQRVDIDEIGPTTHALGHFYDFRNGKLLVLCNTVKGAYVHEVEF